jgi:hypothetical protein
MNNNPSYEAEILATLGKNAIEFFNLLYNAALIKNLPPINRFVLHYETSKALFACFIIPCVVVAVNFRYSLLRRCVTSRKK